MFLKTEYLSISHFDNLFLSVYGLIYCVNNDILLVWNKYFVSGESRYCGFFLLEHVISTYTTQK